MARREIRTEGREGEAYRSIRGPVRRHGNFSDEEIRVLAHRLERVRNPEEAVSSWAADLAIPLGRGGARRVAWAARMAGVAG